MDSRSRNFLDFLISTKNNYDPWIFRKEIAAWAALVLYLPILFAFYKLVKDESNNCVLIIIAIFIVIICGLFILLLFKQYDSIFNLQAERRIIIRWIFRIIDENKIPDGFDFEIPKEKVMPKELCEQIKDEKSILRKSKHIKIFGVTWIVAFKFFMKLFGKWDQKYYNIEIQESIIYNLVVLLTLLLLFYIYLRYIISPSIQV